MTTGTGQRTSYDNVVGAKRTVTDRIIMTDPHDITTISALGLNNESKFSFVNTPGRTYEWLEDAYPAISTTAAATNITNDSTTTTIAVTAGNLFHIGDVVQIGSEYVWVSSISTNTLTVTRNFGGTQATHASTSTVYIRYSARLEGAANSSSPWTETTSGYNYSTIMHKSVNVSRDDQLFPHYGNDNLVERYITKNMEQLLQQLNRIPYHGVRAVGTTSAARSSGGFSTFITTNVTAQSSAALTRVKFDDKFEAVYKAGGSTDLILCDTWAQRKINDMYEGFVETTRSETMGGMIIKQLVHPITGKPVDIVVDRSLSGNLWGIDRRYAGFITIDPFFYEVLAKTGDFTNGQTVGEYGLVVAYNAAHFGLTGYSTSS